MKRIQLLKQEFISEYPALNNDQSTLPDMLTEHLKQMARVENNTIALCHTVRNEYHFLHYCSNDFHPALQGIVPASTLYELIEPRDQDHFVDALRKTFHFLQTLPPDGIKDYALVFELRVRNLHGHYRRIMFKYMMIKHPNQPHGGQLMMILKPVSCSRIEDPSRGIYIINIHTKKFVREYHQEIPTPRQIEVTHMCMRGYIAKEIARQLFISPNTVYNHCRQTIEKTHTDNISHAANYLHDMGII